MRLESSVQWPNIGRFGFRFAFVFLLLALVATFAPFVWIPFLGLKLTGWTDAVSSGAAQWAGQHVFHLTGIAAMPHPTDSRDTALGWITIGLVFVFSTGAAIVWSVLDRRRLQYQTAAVWLRFLLRLLPTVPNGLWAPPLNEWALER